MNTFYALRLRVFVLASLALTISTFSAQDASAGKHHRRKGTSCGTCGQDICVAKSEEKTVEKTIYDTKCEKVCIPAVRFPWEDCNTPKCGWVRNIVKLTKDKEKKKECVWKWSVKETCPECNQRCDSGMMCDSPGEYVIPYAESPIMLHDSEHMHSAPVAPQPPSVAPQARMPRLQRSSITDRSKVVPTQYVQRRKPAPKKELPPIVSSDSKDLEYGELNLPPVVSAKSRRK